MVFVLFFHLFAERTGTSLIMHVHFYEKIWIGLAVLLCIIFVGSILGTTAASLATPPSHMEMIDPKEVLSNKAGWNPGVQKLPNGDVVVTITARIWSFIPDHIEVPAGKRVTFRVTSPDVIHGFEIAGTNVNMMAVPGYVNQMTTQFKNPGKYLLLCNEYCGIGHHAMSTTIEVKHAHGERK